MTDLELAGKIASGDRELAERFIRDYYDPIYRFLRHLTRQVEESEDLTQLTLLRTCRNMGVYDGRASLKTWVLSIALHEYTRWKRRQRFHFSLSSMLPARESGFENVVTGDWLLRQLATLPEKQRLTFLLVEVQQLSLEEAARVLRVPVGTVKSRLHLCKKQLQTRFEIGQGEVPLGTEALES